MWWGKSKNSWDVQVWLNPELADISWDLDNLKLRPSQEVAVLINTTWALLLAIVDYSNELALNKTLLKIKINNYIQLSTEYLQAFMNNDSHWINKLSIRSEAKIAEIDRDSKTIIGFSVRLKTLTTDIFTAIESVDPEHDIS